MARKKNTRRGVGWKEVLNRNGEAAVLPDGHGVAAVAQSQIVDLPVWLSGTGAGRPLWWRSLRDARAGAASVSRYREQTLDRYNQDRAPQEEHEIRDDPGHHLSDKGDRTDGVCRYDQRDRR